MDSSSGPTRRRRSWRPSAFRCETCGPLPQRHTSPSVNTQVGRRKRGVHQRRAPMSRCGLDDPEREHGLGDALKGDDVRTNDVVAALTILFSGRMTVGMNVAHDAT